jgi:1,4-alpha-glucan branching enzyme
MWPFGEENVFECIAESYIPLLNIIKELDEAGIAAKLTVGLTPILVEQLADEHLNQGFLKYMSDRIKAAENDVERYSVHGPKPDVSRLHLARFYLNWFQSIERDYRETYHGDIVGAFRRFQDKGLIEITTSAATHCFSPLLSMDDSLKGQFETGVRAYEKHFGRKPKGVWLPECAYRPAEGKREGVEKWLHDAGLKYFFTESFVIRGGQRAKMRRDFGPYGSIDYVDLAERPVTGLDTYEAYYLKNYPVAVMARHEEAGFQVWSAEHGYPGDPNYREFHKKDDVSGLHYWKLTGKGIDLGQKELYSPETAMARVLENSDHYVGLIQNALTEHLIATGEPGLVMVSFDTELFGHWWFEGITWIKEVIRKLKQYTKVDVVTAAEYLSSNPPRQAIEIPESSWGAGGHYQVWLNAETEWMWPPIHQSEKRMQALLKAFKNKELSGGNGNELFERALTQAARELLLLQSSDWPFLVTTGQAKDYAIERFNNHCERFNVIASMLESENVDENVLADIEATDNCFADISLDSFTAA